LSIATGSIFKDENGDEQQGENEAGISDIGLTLFEDTNSSGVFDPNDDAQLGPTFNTDANGEFRIPGLEDGVYFLILDESDADMPPALDVVPGSNPVMIVIQGNDADGVNFGVVSETGPTDGAGAADAGGSDADAGATDAGDTTAGASDADAGATDAGDTTAGASDADAGATDAGDADAGDADVLAMATWAQMVTRKMILLLQRLLIRTRKP